jgi:hypothetical protein
VVFASGARTVEEVSVSVGASLSPGTTVAQLSDGSPVVVADVSTDDADTLEVGTEVTVLLEDGSEVAGTVTDVREASDDGSDPNAPGDGGEEVTVVVTVADPATLEGRAGEPVDVEVVLRERPGVLVVPVQALVALAEGGYAVERVTAEGTELVAVDPGLFADGAVEVEGDLAEGDQVVVPT